MRLTYKYKKESGYGSVKMKDLPPDPLITKLDKLSYLDKVWDEQRNKLGQLEDILEGHNIETLKELDGLLWYVKQIKDIEEELGIDLITLFKALTEGIYRKTKYDITFYTPTSMSITKTPHLGWGLYHRSYTRLFTKDYGKTWALTKEELQ